MFNNILLTDFDFTVLKHYMRERSDDGCFHIDYNTWNEFYKSYSGELLKKCLIVPTFDGSSEVIIEITPKGKYCFYETTQIKYGAIKNIDYESELFKILVNYTTMNRRQWLHLIGAFIYKYLVKYPLRENIVDEYQHCCQFSNHPLDDLYSDFEVISNDLAFADEMRQKMIAKKVNFPKYDVFISHASADKPAIVEQLKTSLAKLGISIFYDKDSIEWGDKWKERILDGTQKAEFAIIVISENFFDREWTEKELNEFLNRQNSTGQKLILPILHNITMSDLKAKYPTVADIQAIDSKNHSCDEIALMFAKQLIKRLKSIT